MARSLAVQDSVGTVKLAADTVADPALTAAWYPAKSRLLTGRSAASRAAALPAGPKPPGCIGTPPVDALAAVTTPVLSATPAAATAHARARKPFIRRSLPIHCSWPTRRSAC